VVVSGGSTLQCRFDPGLRTLFNLEVAMLTVGLILLLAAFVCTLVSWQGKLPVQVPLLLVILAGLLTYIPK
jgi:hypothetical protein